MVPKPKYKLSNYSESGKKACAFYLSEEGCKNGANCKFLHEKPVSGAAPICTDASSVGSSSSSSVVSSESSDNNDNSFNNAVTSTTITQNTDKVSSEQEAPSEAKSKNKQKKEKKEKEHVQTNSTEDGRTPLKLKPSKKKCNFFNTKAGCQNGANCKFVHEVDTGLNDNNNTKQNKGTSNKASSKQNQEQQQFQKDLLLLQQQQQQLAKLQGQLLKQQQEGLKQQKKSKKRKKKDVAISSVFASQSSNHGNKTPEKTQTKPDKIENDKQVSIFALGPSDSPPQAKKTKYMTPETEQVHHSKFSAHSSQEQSQDMSEEESPSYKLKTKPLVGSYSAMAFPSSSSNVIQYNHLSEDSEDDEGIRYVKELKARLSAKPKIEGTNSSKKHQQTTPLQRESSFRSLSLPIAPFTVKSKSTTTPNKPDANATQDNKNIVLPSPIPTSAEGCQYLPAIEASRAHARYNISYNFDKLKESLGDERDWIQTKKKKKNSISENTPQVIAIDCEMVECKDPVTGIIDGKSLCRISVINAINPSEVLLDTLVKPIWPVTNYRTWVNGITEADLENVKFTLRHAQAFMMALCSHNTVIIGHAVCNDLIALKMEHYCNVDTSFLFKVKGDESEDQTWVPSLKDCALAVLEKEMPTTHDSINDARVSLECCNYFLSNDGHVEEVTRTRKNFGSDTYDSLLVHRIPRQSCEKKDILDLFLYNCFIKPKEVNDIEFGTSTGKTFVRFSTNKHASLAFESLKGNPAPDKTGKLQKKVYMRNGDYVQVRKMMKSKKEK